MNIHFIAIGGAVMHNMAICLSNSNNVSGSDDQIYEPAFMTEVKYRLRKTIISLSLKTIILQ